MNEVHVAFLNGEVVAALIAGVLADSADVVVAFLGDGVLVSLWNGNIRPTPWQRHH